MTVRVKAEIPETDGSVRLQPDHTKPMTKRSRADVVASVEKLGVVAIIRMPDPAALRAVVDALAEGGVRALEVTMTVPRAIELIAEIAPTLPADFLFGGDSGGSRRRRPGDAGLFHTDENPRGLGSGRGYRKGFPRHIGRSGLP